MILEKKDLGIKELNLSSPLNFGSLKRMRTYNKFDFDVYLPTKGFNLQRPLVWDLDQKRALIDSLFKERIGSYCGIKMIPPLSAVHHTFEDKTSIFQIIDGKQRLSTLFDFIDNKFEIKVNGNNYRFSDLSTELQQTVMLYNPLITVKYSYWDDPVSDQDKIDWFEMINFFGTPQDQLHLQKLKK